MIKDSDYRQTLLKQYISSKGIKSYEDTELLNLDFNDWLSKRLGFAEDVFSFFDYLKFDYKGLNNIEVGKGINDSIFYNRIESTIATPFHKDLNNQLNPVIKGDLKVSGFSPIIVNKSNKLIKIDQLNSNLYDTLITYNPYNFDDITKWANIYNDNNKYNIIVAIYGSINDKDKDKKIQQLKEFKELLIRRTYKYSLETNNYTYFGAIGPDEWVRETKSLKR